jgi:hypothetical protein
LKKYQSLEKGRTITEYEADERRDVEEVKKIRKMKPVEGVQFVSYDDYGLPSNMKPEERALISTEPMRDDDVFIPSTQFIYGHFLDTDKEKYEMD